MGAQMTPDEIQKDREAGTLDLSPERVEELAKWLTVYYSGYLSMSGKDSLGIALILRTLAAENAAMKERVAELEDIITMLAKFDARNSIVHLREIARATLEKSRE